MSHNVSLFIKRHVENNSDYILSVVLILFFGVEFYSKICEIHFNLYPSDLSRITKGLISICFFLMLVLSKDYKTLYFLLLFLGVFCVGQFYLNNGYSVDSVLVLLRYLFPLLLFKFYNTFSKPIKTSHFLKLFEYLILLNSILIIIGFLFNIKLFETYNFSRFGYNGLVYASATSSYLYLVALFYFLVKQKNQKRISLKLIVVIISCCLIGTKSIYITLIIILFYFILKRKSKVKFIVLLFLAGLTTFFLYFFIFKSEPFSIITNQKGLITSILSFRNEIFINKLLPFIQNKWTLGNYLFGGFTNLELRSQMGFIDLFIMFGCIGLILYLWCYFRLLIDFKLDTLSRLFLLILILMIFVSGNFFLYSITSLFLIAYKVNVLDTVI